MTKELIFTIQRFPSYRMKILELFESDHDFRQLCNDYCFSMNMLDAIREREPDFIQIQHDYELVSKDLELELLNLFQKTT